MVNCCSASLTAIWFLIILWSWVKQPSFSILQHFIQTVIMILSSQQSVSKWAVCTSLLGSSHSMTFSSSFVNISLTVHSINTNIEICSVKMLWNTVQKWNWISVNFYTRGPAAAKLRSRSRVLVHGTQHVSMSADRSRRRPAWETSWQSSTRYAAVASCSAL